SRMIMIGAPPLLPCAGSAASAVPHLLATEWPRVSAPDPSGSSARWAGRSHFGDRRRRILGQDCGCNRGGRTQGMTHRVLVARIMHETNTFSRVATDMAAFRRRDFHLGNEIPAAYRGTRSAMGASFEAAEKYGWTLIHPVSASANPSGMVTRDAFEE